MWQWVNIHNYLFVIDICDRENDSMFVTFDNNKYNRTFRIEDGNFSNE